MLAKYPRQYHKQHDFNGHCLTCHFIVYLFYMIKFSNTEVDKTKPVFILKRRRVRILWYDARYDRSVGQNAPSLKQNTV